MPTLRDLMTLVCRHAEARGLSFGEQCARDLEQLIRRELGGERIYVQPANSRKDPARAEAIRAAARTLPTGVVSERYGVSRQLIHYHTTKKR
jgi:hypothetical protein